MLCSLECDGHRYRCDIRKVRFLSQLKKGDRLVVSDPATGKPSLVKVVDAGYGYVAMRPMFSLSQCGRWFLHKGKLATCIYVIDEIELE